LVSLIPQVQTIFILLPLLNRYLLGSVLKRKPNKLLKNNTIFGYYSIAPTKTQANTHKKMAKTPNQTSGFYAVRTGKHVHTCIFMFWQDCKDHVDGYPGAEYAVFDDINEAISYTLHLPSDVAIDDVINNGGTTREVNIGTNNVNGALPILPTPRPTQHLGPPQVLPAGVVGPKQNEPVNNNVDGSAEAWEKGTTATNMPAPDMPVIAMAARGGNGSAETTASATKRQKLLDRQSLSISDMVIGNTNGTSNAGNNNAMVHSPPAGVETLANNNNSNLYRKPTRKWEEMFDKLKQYKEHHNTLDVSTNPDYADLRVWVKVQRNQYECMKELKKSSMTTGKIGRLESIGFDFGYVSWDDRLEELKLFKEQHGTLCCVCPVTPDGKEDPKYAELTKWFQKQRLQCGLFLKGKQCSIGKAQMERLFALGLDPADVASIGKTRRSTVFSNNKWESMFDSLKEYKIEHGSCKVPVTLKNSLSKWVTTQRVEYKKLQDGKKSRLTLPQLQKLNDLGFVFQQCERYIRFDEWLERLAEYKRNHGDCRVPKKSNVYPELGNWVCRQRQEYKRYMEGSSTTMNPERIRQLTDIGFVFQAGKRLHYDHGEKKSWDERFQELLEYKRENGHTVVPQTYPKLGEWVKSQRKNYKYLKDGKKAALSTEQALKLADVGFVFDATNRRGKNTT